MDPPIFKRMTPMKQPTNYIATWFYKESSEEASYYPQMGRKGDSALVHSVYMQIQVPFFRTFRHYNPSAELLFFTNLQQSALPPFLTSLFEAMQVEVVTLPYTASRPKNGTMRGRTNSTCTTYSNTWKASYSRKTCCS